MLTCSHTSLFWRAVINLLITLGEPPPTNMLEAIVLNRWRHDKIGSPIACAIIRHAYGCLYRSLTVVDTNKSTFVWQRTFTRTITNFRNAVMRHGVRIVRFNAQRRHSGKTCDLGQLAKEQFESVITIGDECKSFTLSKELTDAVKAADSALSQLTTNMRG